MNFIRFRETENICLSRHIPTSGSVLFICKDCRNLCKWETQAFYDCRCLMPSKLPAIVSPPIVWYVKTRKAQISLFHGLQWNEQIWALLFFFNSQSLPKKSRGHHAVLFQIFLICIDSFLLPFFINCYGFRKEIFYFLFDIKKPWAPFGHQFGHHCIFELCKPQKEQGSFALLFLLTASLRHINVDVIT